MNDSLKDRALACACVVAAAVLFAICLATIGNASAQFANRWAMHPPPHGIPAVTALLVEHARETRWLGLGGGLLVIGAGCVAIRGRDGVHALRLAAWISSAITLAAIAAIFFASYAISLPFAGTLMSTGPD